VPFQRKWSLEEGDYVIDRTLTGPPQPTVYTGTTVSEDGTVVASSPTVNITPSTPVNVTLPGPNEPVVDSQGRLNPRWWRFLNELYQRTGGINDNINRTPTTLLGAGATVAIVFTGNAPSAEITHIRQTPSDSISITGYIPEIVNTS
jgi:hypothetical protein